MPINAFIKPMITTPSLSLLVKKLLNGTFSHAFIDADDTLWHDGKYFRALRQSFVEACRSDSIDIPTAEAALHEALTAVGLGEREFATAICCAAESLNLKPPAKHRLTNVAREFLGHPLELLPNVEAALELLLPVELLLLTKGIQAEQLAKLHRSGLQRFFSAIIVVDRKETSTLSDLLALRALSPGRVVSIGNSIRHDVIPAVTAGATAVWLDHADNNHGRNAALPPIAYRIEGWVPLTAALVESKSGMR